MTKQSKISRYLGSPEFLAAANRGIAQAIAEQRAMGIEPACDPEPHGPPIPGTVTIHPDGSVTASTPEARDSWNRDHPSFAKAELPKEDGWSITFHPDGTIMANKPEALSWALERFMPMSKPLEASRDQVRRRQAIEFAIASVGLEGFKVSPEFQAASERFVRGEIELEDLKQVIERSR